MEATNFLQPAGEPCLTIAAGNYKAFDRIRHLLMTRTRRQAAVEHEPGTADKAVVTLLSSILLASGLDAGAELLAAIVAILHDTLVAVAAAPDRDAALEGRWNYSTRLRWRPRSRCTGPPRTRWCPG